MLSWSRKKVLRNCYVFTRCFPLPPLSLAIRRHHLTGMVGVPLWAVPAFPWHQQHRGALFLRSFSQGVPDLRDISRPWLQEQRASPAQARLPPCRFGQECTPGSPRGQAAASRHEEISQWKHCSPENHFFSSSCEMHSHFFPFCLRRYQ